MTRLETIIMAEATSSPGPEGAAPASGSTPGQETNAPESQVVNQPAAQPSSRWGFLRRRSGTPQPGEPVSIGVAQSEQSAQNSPVTPLKYTLEQLTKISPAARMSFLRALSPKEGETALRTLGLEIRAGAAGPAWMTEIEAAKNQPSKFQETRELYETLTQANLHRDKIPPSRLPDFDQLLKDTEKKMLDLVAGALASPVLAFTEVHIRDVYSDAIQAPKIDPDSESYYAAPPPTPKKPEEHLKDVHNALGRDKKTGTFSYKESFWEYDEETLKARFEAVSGTTIDIQELRSTYEGAASYIASKVAVAIEKDFKGIDLVPNGPGFERVGDVYLEHIQGEVRRINENNEQKRQRERQRARFKERLKWNTWRERFDFAWAENAAELNETVLDWLEFFQQQLPQESADKINNSVQTGRQNALTALEAALHRLEIPARSQVAKELRATIEGHVDVIGGVQLLESPGGFDAYTAYLEDFSNNFNAHHDAVYLRNPKAAIIHDFLSNNDGEICLGGPDSLEKPLDGDTKAFRENLEEQAKAYATTHELYIGKEDFDEAELGEAEIVREIQQLNLPTEKANAEYKKRLGEKLGRYGWNDAVEELLLMDKRHRDKAAGIINPAEKARVIAKIDARTGVFRKIKARLDEEDGLAGLSPDERKDEIRKRIKDQMGLYGNRTLTAEINRRPPGVEQDRKLWRWVKNYNSLREKNGLDSWFPTSWDMVRLSIDTSTKLIDRALKKDEFRAMVEEINDPYAGLTEGETREQMMSEFREGYRRHLVGLGLNLTPQEEEERIDQEIEKRSRELSVKTEDVVFDREKRRAEAERAFNVGRAYQKFLGLDARWGGLTTRVVAQNGETKLRTISSLAKDILKAKIDKEEREIEDKVTQFALTLPNNLTPKQREAATTKKRRLFRRDATFAATLGLREIGIASDLPIWNYHYYGDVAQIQAFAPLVGFTHNDKGYLPELLDKGRREMEAVYSHLADLYMEKDGGEILVVQDDPIVGLHSESWERARVISEGGELALRDLFEARFMVSTSGGVKVPDLISKIGDLGVYDLLWENGCQDLREFQGFIKRRDEVELKKQSFWNTRKWADPIKYAQRLKGAGLAKIFLTGGEVKGQGYVPGTFNEPFDGLWQLRGLFANKDTWLNGIVKQIVSKRDDKKKFIENLMKVLDKKDNNSKSPLKDIDPIMLDNMVKTGGGILKNLIEYMNARRYLTNRAGYAPKNWQYDNELIARAFFKEALKRKPKLLKAGSLRADGSRTEKDEMVDDATLGDEHLSYAPQGRNLVANELFATILRSSSYHTLDEADRRVFDEKAEKTKEDMDRKRTALASQPLPADVQNMINARRVHLTALHTTPENIAKEDARLKRLYIEERLHKEFIGEWAARLAA